MRTANLIVSTGLLLAIGCHPRGRMDYTELDSVSEGRTLPYGVYLPPGWDRETPLPLVILLHGAGDDATSADRRVVTKALDAAIEAGEIPPFLMVMPEGELGFWVNWHDESHHWKDWVLEEVVPDVQRRFPTVEGPQGLHVMGVSMGGAGAMQMWLGEPERFASATILSAPILNEADTRKFLARFMPPAIVLAVFGPPGSDAGVDPYTALAGPDDLQGSQLILGVATRERGPMGEWSETYHQELARRQVPHSFIEFRGSHGWRTWAKVFPLALCQQLQPDCSMTAPGSWAVSETD